jgi:hypothetical protein
MRAAGDLAGLFWDVARRALGLPWVRLYRLWPHCLDVLVLVRPATVVQWHRLGFCLYWHWRSRPGRPLVDREVRALIRQMSNANPLWGAPRIHGELLKLGFEISQGTVAKYMVRRPSRPSPTWRSFLHNQVAGIAAVDMFGGGISVVQAAVRDGHPASRTQEDCTF